MEVTPMEVQHTMSEECLRYLELVELYIKLRYSDDAFWNRKQAGEVLKAAIEYAYSARENAISEEPNENAKKIKLVALKMLYAESLRDFDKKLNEIFDK